MTICAAFLPFRLVYGYSLRLLFPLFPHTPRLSVVKHVVKNRFLNTLVTGDRKRFFIVCRSAADGCFVAPVCRIVPLLERLSKSFMQGQAAQNLHRYRQRRINFRSKHEWPVQQNLPCPHRQPCQCFYGSGHRLHTSHLSPPGSPACRCKNGR